MFLVCFAKKLIDGISSHPPYLNLASPPTMDELWSALSRMKKGKASGKSGILRELLKCGSVELHERLLKVMQDMWEEGSVVGEWKDAVIVPIPKRGNLTECDNWRGISLLDVAGKLFARIIQERLQVIAERILPDSQCGFRRGRGCTDMIFTARQLVEKCREHDDALFVLFVDLKKAYEHGSNISRNGEVKDEVKCRIAKATRSFGCLQKSIFQNRHLSVETKKKVCRAVVLSVLLYGAEAWTVKAESMRLLNSFHNRCVRTYHGSQ